MDWSSFGSFLRTIDWGTLANIAVIVSVFYLIRQFREMRLTTLAQSYSVARDILQEDKVREARKLIFKLGDEGKPSTDWDKIEIDAAQTTCHTYDAVGQMVRNNLLKKSMIVKSWGPSLRRSWEILAPLVAHYRDAWNSSDVWDDFEWLALEAEKHKRKLDRSESMRALRARFLHGLRPSTWGGRGRKTRGESTKNAKTPSTK